MKLRLRIFISATFAVLAFFLFSMHAQSIRAEAEALRADVLDRYGGEVVRLVIATTELSRGAVISPENAVEKDWPVDLVPEAALLSLNECIGDSLTMPVAKGMPLTRLAFEESKTGIEVPSGMVAISLAANDRLSLPQGIEEGAELFAYEIQEDGAYLISDELRVVAPPSNQGSFASSASVTVALDPKDVSDVLRSSAAGTLRLVVPGDDVGVLPAAPQAKAPREVSAEDVPNVSMGEEVAETTQDHAQEKNERAENE